MLKVAADFAHFINSSFKLIVSHICRFSHISLFMFVYHTIAFNTLANTKNLKLTVHRNRPCSLSISLSLSLSSLLLSSSNIHTHAHTPIISLSGFSKIFNAKSCCRFCPFYKPTRCVVSLVAICICRFRYFSDRF